MEQKIRGIGLLFLFLVSTIGGYSQSPNQPQVEIEEESGPKIVADHLVYNFGRVNQGEVVQHVFKIRNEGKEDLIITTVKPSCGCTSPKWTQEAIPPGGEGEIHVVFNTGGKMGPQKKSITVYSNAPKPLVLYLEGEVVAPSVPLPTENKD